ncbi:MAG: uroporphyrinogen decarboxylase family protein [Alloacidobacterium sp.]|jgi:uroporphyrinogen-III decarboxylase
MNRRNFLRSAAGVAGLALTKPVLARTPGNAALTHKQRVDRALSGEDVDRPPFTFYLHYKKPTAQLEAQDHLQFHREYKTDIVKVMNDFDYPKSTTGKWYELKALESPYPLQLDTLRLVRDGLNGDAYFIDTLYGPYMTAMILFRSQPEYAKLGQSDGAEKAVVLALHDFQKQHPDEWHTALEAITQSTINHIHRSKEIGASGALVSIYNAHSSYGPMADYQLYSHPYDKRVTDALDDTKLTFLHLHNFDHAYLGQFTDFNVPVIQYSVKTSGIPISDVRKLYSQTIAGGVDEIDFQKLSTEQMREQWIAAREQAGKKYIATPGCSIPTNSTPNELARFPRALGT